jgi:hypothetical protein
MLSFGLYLLALGLTCEHPMWGACRRINRSRPSPSELAGAEGLEPSTCGFGDRRSTN